MNTSSTLSSSHTVRVWDLPTRVFHWTLTLCIAGLFVTGNVGGNAMVWHFRIGLTVLALLLFRLVWGLVGGRWSRFATFLYSPRSIINYFKGRGKLEHSVGHTPAGAGSIFALLAVLLAQVVSGLISDDEIASAGPLVRFVSSATTNTATNYHKNIGMWIIVGLVILHIAAIMFYLLRKQNLIKPMLHGNKQLPMVMPASADNAGTRIMALVIFGIFATFVVWVAQLAI